MDDEQDTSATSDQADEENDLLSTKKPRRHRRSSWHDVSAPGSFSAWHRKFAAIEIPALRATTTWAIKHSIDVTHLADALKSISDAAIPTGPLAAQARWADSLTTSVSVLPIANELASSAALDALKWNTEALAQFSPDLSDLFAHIAKRIKFDPPIDIAELLESMDRWIPENLRAVEDLDQVATLALDEGLPLSWVPRTEIVEELLRAESANHRHEVLDQSRDEILHDCESALMPLTNEWATECRAVISAMRAGLDGPAQSHASNIIDSVVLALHGPNGRDRVASRVRDKIGDLPIRLAAEHLTLLPLFRAYATWYPHSGEAPPNHYARHPTAHAVGHPGIFAPRSALVSTMLATSLTVQYSPVEELGADDAPAMRGVPETSSSSRTRV